MNTPFNVVAGRIRQELVDIEQTINRACRAIKAAREHPEDQDIYIDSVALNLHDFYTGLERIFSYIASVIDESIPAGREWHRELLQQMGIQLTRVRPPVLSQASIKALEEYMGFRHVVRHVYR